MSLENAREVLELVYDGGERDIELFGYVIGYASGDFDDNWFEKTDDERILDAVKLCEYFVSTGDFSVGQTIDRDEGKFDYVIFDDFSDFRKTVDDIYREKGIEDIDLLVSTWLKKTNLGTKAPRLIPGNIAEIFGKKAISVRE